ncbi:hypothetical protein BDM02DRAFT_3124837 [Thelephora ganbajun]|uniref:Uncharacterized protein n=1 Tax=Thelephora ganbajun TaxID=370292 RepID=A0ACB6YYZ9_THEGA|nr:hypothetical protein BDM02DRAFT_3124837 [Thelephora ganbajun]
MFDPFPAVPTSCRPSPLWSLIVMSLCHYPTGRDPMVFLLGMTWLEIPFEPVGHILRGGVTKQSHRPLNLPIGDREEHNSESMYDGPPPLRSKVKGLAGQAVLENSKHHVTLDKNTGEQAAMTPSKHAHAHLAPTTLGISTPPLPLPMGSIG